MLESLVREEHAKGNPHVNRTMMLGRAMSSMNGSSKRQGLGRENAVVVPYKTVFGMDYWSLLPVQGFSSEELQKAKTPLERIQMTRSKELLEHYAQIDELMPSDLAILGELVTPRARRLVHEHGVRRAKDEALHEWDNYESKMVFDRSKEEFVKSVFMKQRNSSTN
ncbi:hypothetical protein ACA910_020353 [Epithemia clementina (nom. ined.)]